MLHTLSIENFAIIEQAVIDFSQGMTVLSGETGAGKSIIIDALGILCGGRGSNEWIRHGSERLVVEGQFHFDSAREVLEATLAEFGIEYEAASEPLLLRREITQQGKNTIRINGQLANVTLLKKIGAFLVDIHGQNEHQALLDTAQHLTLLDEFAQLDKSAYERAYARFKQAKHAWQHATQHEQDQLQQLNFLEFQIQEIEQANLVIGEDEELEAISKRLQHAQHIQQNIEAVNYLLSDGDNSVLDNLRKASSLLQEIETYHEPFKTLGEQLDQISYDFQEIAHEVAVASGDFDTDGQNIDEIEARLNELGQLKRKYGKTVPELIDHYNTISEEVYRIKHREKYIAELETTLQETYRVAVEQATALHNARQKQATSLIQAIETQLADLYMEKARFQVAFAQPVTDKMLHALIPNAILLNEVGFDQVEFYVATNLGETLKPLVKVASGGELSRFMLALKTVFSSVADAKTMVFDEIDTGVSGRVAQAIAEKISQVAHNHQVLCITHLPQVAAIADEQLYIQKVIEHERTHTTVTTLDDAQRIQVIAQMMSGKTITETSLKLAQELLETLQQKG